MKARLVQAQAPQVDWSVRRAALEDVPGIADVVSELLRELGGTPPRNAAMQASARTLIEDPRTGALLLAKTSRTIVGLLGISWQIAVHTAGRYGLIQDLWVHPDRRGQTIGAALLEALHELAHEQQVTRVEVGLPTPRFPRLSATEAFYRNNGFTPVGLRMRRSYQ